MCTFKTETGKRNVGVHKTKTRYGVRLVLSTCLVALLALGVHDCQRVLQVGCWT